MPDNVNKCKKCGKLTSNSYCSKCEMEKLWKGEKMSWFCSDSGRGREK